MTESTRPSVLITNDDGILAPGIIAMVKALRDDFDVTVVAPDKQMSAVGHAITIHSPLRVKEVQYEGAFFGYAVNGTPADCVKLGLRSLMKKNPDMIFSGINHGGNTAASIMYSGTVSAATEGTFLGIPSVAISLHTYEIPDFSFAARIARMMAKEVLSRSIPKGILLNVNVPAVPESEIAGIRVTRMGNSIWDDKFDSRKDPNDQFYYWLTGEMMIIDDDDDQDEVAVLQKYVSITPIQFDLTAHQYLKDLAAWDFKL